MIGFGGLPRRKKLRGDVCCDLVLIGLHHRDVVKLQRRWGDGHAARVGRLGPIESLPDIDGRPKTPPRSSRKVSLIIAQRRLRVKRIAKTHGRVRLSKLVVPFFLDDRAK